MDNDILTLAEKSDKVAAITAQIKLITKILSDLDNMGLLPQAVNKYLSNIADQLIEEGANL